MLVVEGSLARADGAYCTIGGRSNLNFREAAAGAAAIIATGNCAALEAFPGPAQPHQARGVMDVITGKPIINIPGCPAIPEAFTGSWPIS